jgi:hypothetical protein
MFDSMVQVLTRPAAFFRTLKDDDRVVSRAFLIVLLVAVLGAVSAYFAALPLADATRGTVLALAFNPFFAALATLAVLFLSWLVYGLLVRMSAGMEAKPWAVVAYAATPQLLVYAGLIIMSAFFPATITPLTGDLTDPVVAAEAATSVTAELQASLVGRVSTILSYASSLWWLVLIFIGVRETAGQRKATTATIIVAVISLAFIAVPFLLSPVAQ